MKSSILLIFFSFLIKPFAFSQNESLDQLNYQTEALWEVKNFTAAEELYQKLDPQKLSEWQKSRLQYNLGTLALVKNQTADAITELQKIAPSDLSLPHFGRDLLINQAIAYLEYAKKLTSDSPFFDLKGIYLTDALKALNQADLLNCHLQKMEENIKGFSCLPHDLIKRWIQKALQENQSFHQQKAQYWMNHTSIEALATFLSILLQQLNSQTKSLNPTPIQSMGSYLKLQTESLSSIWTALKQKKFSSPQLAHFSEAAAAYLEANKSFDKNDFSAAAEHLSKAIEKLNDLNFKENISLNLARLSYAILLLQPSLAESDLQIIQWEIDQIKGDKKTQDVITKMKLYLQTGEKSLNEDNHNKARFFLLAGFGWLESLLPSDALSPIDCLEKALNQTSRSLEMIFFAKLLPSNDEIGEMLKEQQQLILNQGKFFIPSVLKEQMSLFTSSSANCQQFPWDQVIPLFDHGYFAAKSAEKQLTPFNPELVAALLEQTLQDWHKALHLLKNPPMKNQTKGESSSAPKNLAETFRLIQEMYLEDQTDFQPIREEFHSW